MNILFHGWTKIYHSYSIVNCYQLIHFVKKYNKNINIYIEESNYYKDEWDKTKVDKLFNIEEYDSILNNLKIWKGEPIDIIYMIKFPYDVSEIIYNNKKIPKCIFYTNENFILRNESFKGNIYNEKSYYTCPSLWCYYSLKNILIPDNKNRIISHGVDTNIYFLKNKDNRKYYRNKYKILDDEILLINISAMTLNKGIDIILLTLYNLIYINNKTNYKLLLKGSKDLYQSNSFFELIKQNILNNPNIDSNKLNNLINKHIIFLDEHYSFEDINNMYNMADVYISPYSAEGFNLCLLEALATGLPIIVPHTGASREYIRDIYENKGNNYIIYIHSILHNINNKVNNKIDYNEVLNTIISNEKYIINMKENRYIYYNEMIEYIKNKYSWYNVVDELYNYFKYIINN
jgi:glycosyltransferase involved in cell wall biosynthesis